MIIAKGKYREWLTEDGLLQLEGWARDGLTDKQISQKAGITPTTLYDWEKRFPQISDAIKKGKAPVDIRVENALLKRALGYDYEEVVTEIFKEPNGEDQDGRSRQHIKRVTRHVPPDVTAQIFWLKNRRPDKWRDKPEQQGDTEALKNAREVLGVIDSAID